MVREVLGVAPLALVCDQPGRTSPTTRMDAWVCLNRRHKYDNTTRRTVSRTLLGVNLYALALLIVGTVVRCPVIIRSILEPPRQPGAPMGMATSVQCHGRALSSRRSDATSHSMLSAAFRNGCIFKTRYPSLNIAAAVHENTPHPSNMVTNFSSTPQHCKNEGSRKVGYRKTSSKRGTTRPCFPEAMHGRLSRP